MPLAVRTTRWPTIEQIGGFLNAERFPKQKVVKRPNTIGAYDRVTGYTISQYGSGSGWVIQVPPGSLEYDVDEANEILTAIYDRIHERRPQWTVDKFRLSGGEYFLLVWVQEAEHR